MKVNWTVRFHNRLWLSSFISAILMIIYTVLDAFGIIPDISEAAVFRIADAILLILSLLGVIIDPTTSGINDSNRARGYDQPWNDNYESTEDGGNG